VHFRVSHLNSLGSKNWNPKRNRKRDALNKEQSLEKKRTMPLNAKKGAGNAPVVVPFSYGWLVLVTFSYL
jgi:hypothetical protein